MHEWICKTLNNLNEKEVFMKKCWITNKLNDILTIWISVWFLSKVYKIKCSNQKKF